MNEERADNLVEVEDGVLSAIKSGKAKMRPKWLFALLTGLRVTAVVIVLLVLIYLASFIFFILHESGAWFATDFGFAGWFALLGALPWMLISFALIFVILLALLFRHYQLGYQLPLVYSLLGILFLIIGGGLVIVQTSLSQEVFREGMQQELPLVGSLYSGFTVPELDNVHHGTVVSPTPTGFIIQDLRGRVSNVIIGSSTAFPYGNIFMMGDTVIVFGDRDEDGIIYASGIERLAPGE